MLQKKIKELTTKQKKKLLIHWKAHEYNTEL